MELTNRDRAGRGFELLAEGLEPFVERHLTAVAPGGMDWLEWLSKRLYGPKSTMMVSRSDPLILLRAIVHEEKVFQGTLSRTELSYAQELWQCRHQWAHNSLLNDADTHRLLDTMERLLRAVGAVSEADLTRRLRWDQRPGGRPAGSSSPAPPGDGGAVFEVAIGPGAVSETFWVQVVQSPAGDAATDVKLGTGELLAQTAQVQQAVLASAAGTRRVPDAAERCVRVVGSALFTALLGSGDVAACYRASMAIAAERGQGLRVVLRIEDPQLAGLPWEAMYDESLGSYLCRREQLVRKIPVPALAAPLAVDLPLRILGVVSSPRDLPALDEKQEKAQLARALRPLTDQGLAEVHWAPRATWGDLQETLLEGCWHAVHYIGHGDFDPGQDEGVLALTGEDGRRDLVEASRLVDLLRQARPMPRLIVLNCCAGGVMSARSLFSGTAAALVQGGVSAVAGMQYDISHPAAVAFTRGFYGALTRGRGVDDAVSSGRVAILGISGQTLEWITPVLYLRGEDNRLFTLAAPAPAARDDRSGAPGTGARGTPAGTGRGMAGGMAGRPREDTGADPAGSSADSRPGPRRAARGRARWLRWGAGVLAGLITAGTVAAVTLLRTAHPGYPVTFTTPDGYSVTAASFSPGGSIVATGTSRSKVVRTGGHAGIYPEDGSTYLWRSPSWTVIAKLHDPGSRGVTAALFSPDGSMLAIVDANGRAYLWNVASHRLAAILRRPQGIDAVAWAPAGMTLAIGDGTGTIELYGIGTRSVTAAFHDPASQGRFVNLAFSPDGTLLAAGTMIGQVAVWDLTTRDRIAAFTTPALGLTPRVAAFDGTGRILVSGGLSGRIYRWDMTARAPLPPLQDPSRATVYNVAFASGGTRLAAIAGIDRSHFLYIWDNVNGPAPVVHTLRGNTGPVAFSPAGGFMVTGTGGDHFTIWDMSQLPP